MNGRARRERNRSDAGYYGTIQLLGVVVGVSWFFMFIATLPGDMWVVPPA